MFLADNSILTKPKALNLISISYLHFVKQVLCYPIKSFKNYLVLLQFYDNNYFELGSQITFNLCS